MLLTTLTFFLISTLFLLGAVRRTSAYGIVGPVPNTGQNAYRGGQPPAVIKGVYGTVAPYGNKHGHQTYGVPEHPQPMQYQQQYQQLQPHGRYGGGYVPSGQENRWSDWAYGKTFGGTPEQKPNQGY